MFISFYNIKRKVYWISMSRRKIIFVDQEDEIVRSYDSSHPPRFRFKFSKSEEMHLEKFYEKNPYPNNMERIGISIFINIPVKNIKVWFQNRRARDRRENQDTSS
jgi:homeobox-leucine zipper protein